MKGNKMEVFENITAYLFLVRIMVYIEIERLLEYMYIHTHNT